MYLQKNYEVSQIVWLKAALVINQTIIPISKTKVSDFFLHFYGSQTLF